MARAKELGSASAFRHGSPGSSPTFRHDLISKAAFTRFTRCRTTCIFPKKLSNPSLDNSQLPSSPRVLDSLSTYGNQVVIDHGQGLFIQSAHLDSANVKPGETVTAGQEIGAVGRTGNTPSSGDTHLHFEVRVGGPSPSAADGKVAGPLTQLPSPTLPETTSEN